MVYEDVKRFKLEEIPITVLESVRDKWANNLQQKEHMIWTYCALCEYLMLVVKKTRGIIWICEICPLPVIKNPETGYAFCDEGRGASSSLYPDSKLYEAYSDEELAVHKKYLDNKFYTVSKKVPWESNVTDFLMLVEKAISRMKARY